jgi:nucleoside-diphosphate-sugar epimerase
MFDRLDQLGYATYGFDIADRAAPLDARDFFRTDDRRFDLVVHCAAVVGGRAMIDGNPLAVAVDLSIDAEMFGWAIRTHPGRVVYFSSSAAYPTLLQDGTWQSVLSEDILDGVRPIAGLPDQTYGWAKLTGELLAGYARAEGIPVHVFRPFSGYGEDQALDYPFPSFIDRARRKADPFDIWGDGEQERDFIHIDDLVGAVFAAIEQDVRGPVNLCTGRATSFNELAKLVREAAGYSPEFRHLPAAPTGVRRRVGDPTQMQAFYTPRISLEEGVARALKGTS